MAFTKESRIILISLYFLFSNLFTELAFAGEKNCFHISESSANQELVDIIEDKFNFNYKCGLLSCEVELNVDREYTSVMKAQDIEICIKYGITPEYEYGFVKNENCMPSNYYYFISLNALGNDFEQNYSSLFEFAIYEVSNPRFFVSACWFAETSEVPSKYGLEEVSPPKKEKFKTGYFLHEKYFYSYGEYQRF